MADSVLIMRFRLLHERYINAYTRWSQSLRKIHLVGDESIPLRGVLWNQYVEARDAYHTCARTLTTYIEDQFKEGDPDIARTLRVILNENTPSS